jgi:hypothetical protein
MRQSLIVMSVTVLLATSTMSAAWTDWERLDGPSLASGPAAVSSAVNRIDIFAMTDDHKLLHRFWNGSHWSSWITLPGRLSMAPAVVSTGPNLIDLFYVDEQRNLHRVFWNGNAWGPDQDTKIQVDSPPAALYSPGTAHITLYSLRNDNVVQKATVEWGNRGFTQTNPEFASTKPCCGEPQRARFGLAAIAVPTRSAATGVPIQYLAKLFYIDERGRLMDSWTNDFGGQPASAPTAVPRPLEGWDVFVKWSDGTLFHRWQVPGGGPAVWEGLGGQLTSAPAATAWPGRVDVFVRGTDNRIWHRFWH